MKTLNQITKILIAIEDSQYSERAAGYGFDLAEKLNASVALLHVNEVPVGTSYIADPMLNESQVVLPDLIQLQDESSKKLLDRISEVYAGRVPTYTYTKLGNPRDEILATAEEWGADMIILGTHGRTGFDHFISGSVSEKVVRKAKCPVLIIPNKEFQEEQA
jgi:nucleotide-binding universal stress UspA family protein